MYNGFKNYSHIYNSNMLILKKAFKSHYILNCYTIWIFISTQKNVYKQKKHTSLLNQYIPRFAQYLIKLKT